MLYKILLNNNIYLLLLISEIAVNVLATFPKLSNDPNHVRFLFYNKPWPDLNNTEIKFGLKQTIPKDFKPRRPLFIFCHGYSDGPLDPDGVGLFLKGNFQTSLRANMLAVDYRKLCTSKEEYLFTDTPDFINNFIVCIQHLGIVGKRVAEFILWMERLSLADYDYVHIVGWSLGGHLAGRIGREYQKLRADGRKLARVTSLDPAGPLFNFPPLYLNQATRSGDASFVDAYHSNVGVQGGFISTADADVFLNGVIIQPASCTFSQEIWLTECSHSFAVKAFVASFRRLFIGCRVSPSLLLDKCEDTTVIGLYMPSTARGKFYAKLQGV